MIDREYSVVLMPFPGDIYAAVRISPDGYPTIYINDNLAPQARKRALEHELRHLRRDDFYNTRSIRSIERKRGKPCRARKNNI